MSKERAARIANSPGSSKRGAKSAGSGTKRRAASQGGTRFPSALSCDRFALASAGLCAQRVARRFAGSCDEHRLGQRDDREARVRVGIAVEVELARTDQNAGSRVLELAGSGPCAIAREGTSTRAIVETTSISSTRIGRCPFEPR